MAIRRKPAVVDEDGERATLRRVRVDDPRAPLAVIELRTGETVEVPFDHLWHHEDGGYLLRGRWRDFGRSGAGGVTIPVVVERVKTEVRPAPAERVRVKRRVVSERQVVETPVWHEHVDVERVAVDRYVDRMPEPRQEGDTLVIPCVEEVVVVEKRLRIREELRVRVVREQHVDRQTVVLRRHEVDVERVADSPLPITKKH